MSSASTSRLGGKLALALCLLGTTLSVFGQVCQPPVLQVDVGAPLVEGGVRRQFFAAVSGTPPITNEWTFRDESNNALFSVTNLLFSSPTMDRVVRLFGPFDKVPASFQVLSFNACGQDGSGGIPPTCSPICLSVGGPSTLSGTAGSGGGPILTSACGTLGSSGKWFRMFTQDAGTGIVSTEGSTYDTVVGVYRGQVDDSNSLVLVACTNSLGVNNYLSRLQFPAQPTTNYWLVVDKASATTGSLVLKYGITTLAPPTLNAINNPSPIDMNSGLHTVSFSGISASPPGNTLLTVSASSGNPALIPNPTVNYTSPSATGTLTYSPVSNAAGSVAITVTVRDAGLDGIAGNGDDGVTSRTFTVVVNPVNKLFFDLDPRTRTVMQGDTAMLSALANSPPLSYQWYFNSTMLGGETRVSLSIVNFQKANEGAYYLVATNTAGSATSGVAFLYLADPLRFVSYAVNGGRFQYRLVGRGGANFVLEQSITSSNWTVLYTNLVPTGVFDDSVAVGSRRYFRARLLP